MQNASTHHTRPTDYKRPDCRAITVSPIGPADMELDRNAVRIGLLNQTFEDVKMLNREDARRLSERLMTHLLRTAETQEEFRAILATLKMNLEEASSTYRALRTARGWKD